jgi:hypothetical protein
MLGEHYAEALETLLFFHPQQGRFRRDITDSVERHGSPRIICQNGGLRIQLPKLQDVQTLYALTGETESRELVGAMIYTRTDEETIEILHLVVQDDYTARGKNAREGLAFLLVEELCRVGLRIRGVRNVRLAYDRGQVILKQIQVAAPQTGNA